jgi:signal peptidase II
VRRAALIAAIVAVADQLTKLLVMALMAEGQARTIIPGLFNLVHWHNSGAAWGLFQNYNIVLTIVSALTVVAMYFFRHSLLLDHPVCQVALGLITGGIIGNLIDRVRLKCVVDFLDFYINGHHWPAFNVADSAICVGVGLYLLGSWLSERAAERRQSVS